MHIHTLIALATRRCTGFTVRDVQPRHRSRRIPRGVASAGLALLCVVAVLGQSGTDGAVLIARDEGRDQAQAAFQSTLQRAISAYNFRTIAQSNSRRREAALEEQEDVVQQLMQQKTDLRRQIVLLQEGITTMAAQYAVDPGTLTGTLLPEMQAFDRSVADAYAVLTGGSSVVQAPHVLASVLRGQPAVALAGAELQTLAAVRRERARLQGMLTLRAAADTVVALREQHAALLDESSDALASLDSAKQAVARSQAEIRQIQAIMRDVHDQVLKLQAEMARIDARLKARAERALLEKGLIGPRQGTGNGTLAAAPSIQWPVRGRVSAGFLDAGYRNFFGVPHYGIDIVVPEGTPVRSAAEGVIFLVRDGGATGYTYVLVGHRGGVATLYGHLSVVTVATGQEVDAGQVIGLSGGTPGTPGAGPLTSGAHLHFEVIETGTNVNPLTVLPQ